MDMDTQHGHGQAAKDMDMDKQHGHAVCKQTSNMDMDMEEARTWISSMYMNVQNEHGYVNAA
jgi:hypothetical protein